MEYRYKKLRYSAVYRLLSSNSIYTAQQTKISVSLFVVVNNIFFNDFITQKISILQMPYN